MKQIMTGLAMLLACSSCTREKNWTVASPDGNVTVRVFYHDPAEGKGTNLTYDVLYNGRTVLLESPLGIERKDASFAGDLEFVSAEKSTIDETYTLKAGKRLKNRNHANESVLTFSNEEGNTLQLIVRAYDDGVAYRYRFPESESGEYTVIEEKSGFQVPLDGKGWIHPYDWNDRLKPSYEQYCREVAVGEDSPYEQGWGFPMLFHTNGLWMMITEAVLDGTYCATHVHSTDDGLYRIAFAEREEVIVPDDPRPVSTLPWSTPWRVIMVGDQLGDVVESTLVQNLNPPSRIADESWIRPGRSSWSWWSDGSTASKYEVQMEYVDFTAEMGWEYMLIDAGWPRIDPQKMEHLLRYAESKGVGVWLWYHSGAGRTGDSLGMDNLMSFPEARRSELARIQKLGVKGIKVDFFDTDKQSIVKMYDEILKDAADHHILVNFHGASLPRGLERTWPNLMTTEAIKGAEGFGRQPNCDRAPQHNATVPFTRNVVGSMDYTPVTFSNKIRQGVEAFNRTTYPHQLALSVVFESGVQNFADNYKSYEALPGAPKEFLKKVPTVWDETKLVAGYPGDFVILARRRGGTWWIGGINGKDEPREVSFELPFIPAGKRVELLVDGAGPTDFSARTGQTGEKITVEFAPNGGFAATVQL